MKKTIFLCFFVAASLIGNAQEKDSSVTIIFSEKSSQRTPRKKRVVAENTNTIKIAPLGLISGTFPVYFERVVNDYFTVQVGLGLTGRNYVRKLFDYTGNGGNATFELPSNISPNASLRSNDIGNYDNRIANIGFMASIQPRFYYDSDAPDGGFFGASFSYINYSFSSPKAVINNGSIDLKGANQAESETFSDIMGNYGYQNVYDRLSVEYTFEIGVRFISGKQYVAGVLNNQIQDGFATYAYSKLNYNIGFKVGYHF